MVGGGRSLRCNAADLIESSAHLHLEIVERLLLRRLPDLDLLDSGVVAAEGPAEADDDRDDRAPAADHLDSGVGGFHVLDDLGVTAPPLRTIVLRLLLFGQRLTSSAHTRCV